MKKTENELLAEILLILGYFLFAFVYVFYNFYVLTKVWQYVMVPIGLQPIGLMRAWGISILINLVSYKYEKIEEFNISEQWIKLLGNTIRVTLAWGLVYCFFGR